MSMQANIHEAKTHFSQLIDRVMAGEEVIIAKNGKGLVRMIALETPATQRTPGLSRGKGQIGADFDSPLEPDVAQDFEQ